MLFITPNRWEVDDRCHSRHAVQRWLSLLFDSKPVTITRRPWRSTPGDTFPMRVIYSQAFAR